MGRKLGKVITVYPKLVRKMDRRYKLSDIQIAIIKKLREEGWSTTRLSKKYGVSTCTISYHTNPEVNTRMKAKNAKRRHDKTDEDKEKYNANKRRIRAIMYDTMRPYLNYCMRKIRGNKLK